MSARVLRRAAWLAIAAVAFIGCQGTPGPAPTGPTAAAQTSLEQLQAEAAARMAGADWNGARETLEEALRRRPADARMRFLHAIVLVKLGLRDHAAEGFAWVVEHGATGSDEVEEARRWLVREGVLASAEPSASPEPVSEEPSGRLHGRTAWPVDENVQATVDLVLEGTGATTAGRTYTSKALLNDQYEFPPLVPGDYRLRARLDGTELWDMPVVIREGEPTVVNLGPRG